MKSIRKFWAIAGLLAAASVAMAQTQTSAVNSGSSATSYSGNAGGSSLSFAANQQRASTSAGPDASGSVSIFGQRVGAAGVSGNAATSTGSVAAQISTGSGTGAASAAGLSTTEVSGTRSYNAGANVTGNAAGDTSTVSGSNATVGRNGLAVVGANASGSYAANASSYRVGIFTENRGADSSSSTTAVTSTPTQFTLGAGTVTLQNEAASNASAVGRSGIIVH